MNEWVNIGENLWEKDHLFPVWDKRVVILGIRSSKNYWKFYGINRWKKKKVHLCEISKLQDKRRTMRLTDWLRIDSTTNTEHTGWPKYARRARTGPQQSLKWAVCPLRPPWDTTLPIWTTTFLEAKKALTF